MKIKLNEKNSLDLPKLIAGKLLVQANSGGGKSWLIRRLIEQAYGKVQIIVIDPEGEFSTLREKFDFVLAGKGGDTPADPKSAALLARKLLELKVSAIIDLYELHPQERKHFVRLFLDSMVNAPKELYHDCLVVLDEAHMFVPEKDESEAASAVIDMASRGRKRGYSLVLATQRISKLAKDAAAECNNKLIGRTSLDIDRKRAADELGITSKEETLALRTLEPGEFFAFGPAISNEVIKIKVGDVHTSIHKAGSQFKVAPPTPAIKNILAKLADLPQEARKEAETMQSLKAEIRTLKAHRCPQVAHNPKDVERTVKEVVIANDKKWQALIFEERNEFLKHMQTLFKVIEEIGKQSADVLKTKEIAMAKIKKGSPLPPPVKTAERVVNKIETPDVVVRSESNELTVSEQKVLDAVAWCEALNIKAVNVLVAFLSGYSPHTSSYQQARGALGSSGLVRYVGGAFAFTEAGRQRANPPERPTTEEELHRAVLDKLDAAERKVLTVLLKSYPDGVPNDELATQAGYSPTTSSYQQARGSLGSFGLIEYSGGIATAEDILFLK